ncbi:hypothetical protein DAPPUDRAFT_104994 [Daphnia pulex]|uniref:Uncharacterized protein n=1 Tax=Daphnia pulex TaxID=6669 RepID=E9GP21_DAPPU|nr:hypothetical protein DAPPUDRAFT_104994 [Daphnia pulex]|eukprot:EFX78760.1 hypothetical protein DAPPUDRAFT_104994 [Daphnia pulex]
MVKQRGFWGFRGLNLNFLRRKDRALISEVGLLPLVCVLMSTNYFPQVFRHYCFGFQCLRILLCETSLTQISPILSQVAPSPYQWQYISLYTTPTSISHVILAVERLWTTNEVPRPLLRIAEDGITDIAIKVNDLLSREPVALTCVTDSVLVAIIHGEIDRLLVNSSHTQPKGLLQSVKALVSSVEWPFVLTSFFLLSTVEGKWRKVIHELDHKLNTSNLDGQHRICLPRALQIELSFCISLSVQFLGQNFFRYLRVSVSVLLCMLCL